MNPATGLRKPFRRLAGRLPMLALLAVAVAMPLLPAAAQQADDGRKALRICRDPNNLPFQNARGEGFEDKIAELFAADLGVKVEAFDYPARFNFIRNTLRFKLPGDDFPCDLVMDVPAGFSQGTASTRPYYRSTYALAFPGNKALAGITTVEQFLALPQEKLAKLKIGVIDKSPASDWLAKRGLLDIGDHDLHAGSCECAHHGETQTARTAGDDGDLSHRLHACLLVFEAASMARPAQSALIGIFR